MMVKCLFPYYGNKRTVADRIWQYFGDLKVYCEPFAGTASVLLSHPPIYRELLNDIDGYIVNLFRAVRASPEEVAKAACFPVNETELHARHCWLMNWNQHEKLYNDPEYYDVQAAGYWLYGQRIWIGSGWCRNKIPSGKMPRSDVACATIPNQGPLTIHNYPERRPDVRLNIKKKRPKNIRRPLNNVVELDVMIAHMHEVAARLKWTKILCGDWKRVCTPGILLKRTKQDPKRVGIFFDPPYAASIRTKNIYTHDSMTIAKEVEKWAKEQPYKIVLAGYEGDYDLPGWECHNWNSTGCSSNSHKERLWFKPV